MPPLRNSQIPFTSAIDSFLELLKAQMPHALNSKTLKTNRIKDGSAKTIACKAAGLLGLGGPFADLSWISG